MTRWKPDICSGGRCSMLFTGDMWSPDTLRFESVCNAHETYPDDASRLAAIKDENQAMSYARAKMAQEICKHAGIPDVPDKDGARPSELLEPGIAFEFDAQRNIKLLTPAHLLGAVQAKLADIQSEVSKVSAKVTVE